MAAGLALPVRTLNGRAVLSVGEDQLKKIIMTCIADCDSANPYQELGIDTAIVFTLNDDQTKAYARRRITDAFKRLEAEGRARLNGAPKFDMETSGELTCTISYFNMETTLAEDITLRGSSPFALYKSLTEGNV